MHMTGIFRPTYLGRKRKQRWTMVLTDIETCQYQARIKGLIRGKEVRLEKCLWTWTFSAADDDNDDDDAKFGSLEDDDDDDDDDEE